MYYNFTVFLVLPECNVFPCYSIWMVWLRMQCFPPLFSSLSLISFWSAACGRLLGIASRSLSKLTQEVGVGLGAHDISPTELHLSQQIESSIWFFVCKFFLFLDLFMRNTISMSYRYFVYLNFNFDSTLFLIRWWRTLRMDELTSKNITECANQISISP